MILILCVDDQLGLLFNRRRQSQDRVLREHLLALTAGKNLWVNRYTAGQFSENAPQLRVDEDFPAKAAPGDYCFAENADFLPYADRIETLILFRWNHVYPADCYLPIDLQSWRLAERTDFAGFSHEKITQEVYAR